MGVRQRYIWDDAKKKLVKEEEYSRGDVPKGPYVIPDEMPDALVHPCTGKCISSKSKFRKITKEHGCIEYGTEKLEDRRTKSLDFSGIKEELKRVIENG